MKTVCDKVVQNDWWGRHLLRENVANTDPPPCTTPIFNQYSLVAPQQ